MNQMNQFGLLAIVLLVIGCGRPADRQADGQTDLYQQEVGGLDDATTIDSDVTADDDADTTDADADSTDDDDELDPDRIIYATPQECFAAWQQASKNKDTATLIGCLAKWDRNQRTGWYAYFVDREVFFARDNADAAKSLLEQYGIKPGSVIAHVHQTAGLPPEHMANYVATIGTKIDPPMPFVIEAAKLVEVTIGGEQIAPEEMTLDKVDVHGRLAIGQIKIAKTGTTERIYFIQEAGSWLITSNPMRIKRK